MATSTHRLLLGFSILLGLLAITATARPGRHFHPCKTLILFSTSTSTSLDRNPNFSPQNPSLSAFFSRGRSVTFFITEVRDLDPEPSSYPSIFVDRAASFDEEDRSLPYASFRNRTKDILSVVGSLLFGVGCGALTAATLFLMWSLFAPNRFDFRDSDSDDEFDSEEDGDEFSDDVKKMGYVAIPAADSAPVAVPPAKEVV